MKTYVPDNAKVITGLIKRSRDAGHTPLHGATQAERRANFFRNMGLDENGEPLKEEREHTSQKVHFAR